MQYFGGKHNIAKHLCQFLNSELLGKDNFYDLFCGACNITAGIHPNVNRYANDIRKFMISTMSAGDSSIFPDFISEEDYQNAKLLPETDPLHGFVLVGCSFGGKYCGGYARGKRKGASRNYTLESKKGLIKKFPLLQHVNWSCGDYSNVAIKSNSIVYCDIPYHGTTGYRQNFDHDRFYNWVSKQKETVFISEYEGSFNPLNLPVVWKFTSRQGMRIKDNTCKRTTEILYRMN